MDFLLDVDLDWLCLGAEFAAGLLILSLAWRPDRMSAKALATQVASPVDWEPLQVAHARAVTGTGRSLALRKNPTDEQRLRDLYATLPIPSRDRLTGTLNANGMDRLIREWSCESEMSSYPSCYAMISISSIEQMMEQQGAACIEHAVKAVSEILSDSLAGSASISRYQPHSFLLHCIGKSLPECRESLSSICEQIGAPEFFSFHEESISLRCDTSFWPCNRSVEPDELLQLLSEFGEESPAAQEEAPEEVAAPEPEVAPEPEKPFSIDALAQFPCPWDDPPDEPSVPIETKVPEPVSDESKPSVVDSQGPAEAASPETLEGFASTDQIDELLAQLNTDFIPEPVMDEPLEEEPIQPIQSEFDESTSIFGPEDDDSDMSRVAQAPENLEDSLSGKAPPPPKLEMPDPVTELPNSRSIYTDDIEESILKDDLASLFAAVRSSAVGDFGYDGKQGSKSGPDKPSPPQ